MSSLGKLRKLGYEKEKETDNTVFFTKTVNGLKVILGIGKLFGVGMTVNGHYGVVDTATLRSCISFMIEKGWLNLSDFSEGL